MSDRPVYVIRRHSFQPPVHLAMPNSFASEILGVGSDAAPKSPPLQLNRGVFFFKKKKPSQIEVDLEAS